MLTHGPECAPGLDIQNAGMKHADELLDGIVDSSHDGVSAVSPPANEMLDSPRTLSHRAEGLRVGAESKRGVRDRRLEFIDVVARASHQPERGDCVSSAVATLRCREPAREDASLAERGNPRSGQRARGVGPEHEVDP